MPSDRRLPLVVETPWLRWLAEDTSRRSYQPIVVTSRPGSSAATVRRSGSLSRSSGQRESRGCRPGRPRPRRSRRQARDAPTFSVLPNHHLMSVTVAGPNVHKPPAHQLGACHPGCRRCRAWQAATRPSASKRGRDIVHAPSLWPAGRCRPRTDSTVKNPWSQRCFRHPHRFPRCNSRTCPPASGSTRAKLFGAWPRPCSARCLKYRSGKPCPATHHPSSAIPALCASATRPACARFVGPPGHWAAPNWINGRSLGPHRPQWSGAFARCLTNVRPLVEFGVQIGDKRKPGSRAPQCQRYGVGGGLWRATPTRSATKPWNRIRLSRQKKVPPGASRARSFRPNREWTASPANRTCGFPTKVLGSVAVRPDLDLVHDGNAIGATYDEGKIHESSCRGCGRTGRRPQLVLVGCSSEQG